MKNITIIILLLFSLGYLQAQVANNSSLEKLGEDVQEKSILITDRDLYIAGENICFKTFNIINNSTLKPDLSKVVYIEVFNHQQSIIKEKFNVRNGCTNGIIQIPNEITSGNYFIRAYTKYQLNLAPESIFTQSIRIINPETQLQVIEINPDRDIKTAIIDGNLEIGMESKVAFFIQPYLFQSSENISLIDEEEGLIQILKPMVNGLGEFTFTPTKSSEYFIKINLKDGNSIKRVVDQSFNPLLIKTFSTNEILRVNFSLNDDAPSFTLNDSLRLYVLSPTYKTKGESSFKMDTKVGSIIIAQNILEEGINYLVIKNKEGSILKIHPVSKHSKKNLKVQIITEKSQYKRRELVNVQVQLPEILKKSVAHLSISVIKKGAVKSLKHLPSSILKNPLLLNSWMVLNEPQNKLQAEIDLLMKLYEIDLNTPQFYAFLENKQPSETFWLPETGGISISGLIRNKITKEGQENVKITASTFGNNAQTHFTKTASDGSFLFALNNLNGEQLLSLKMPDYEAENLEFLIHKDFANLPSFQNNPLWISPQEESLLNEMYFNHQAQKAFHNKQTSTLLSLDYNPVSWIPDTTIYMKDYVTSENMEQLIDEILPFVHARETNGDYTISIQDKEINTNYSSPFILIDNYPVTNLNALLSLNPKAFEKVSLNYSPQNHGESRLNGIISFFTKTNDFAGYPTIDASIFVNYQTASIDKKTEFICYDDNLMIESSNPDFRNLIFWEPNINISDNKPLSFYTSDNVSGYEIIVKGMSEDGQIISGRSSINIVR